MTAGSDFLQSVLAAGERSQTLSMAKKRALSWARVSTEEQAERGFSIEEQQRQIRDYAAKHDIEIVAEFQESTSAFQKESQRVEFHRMVARAKEDVRINTILIHDFSRFSRDSLKAKQLVRDLHAKGVKVVSLNDGEFDPESVQGVYMEAITYAKNEAYSREVAFHTRKGCRANIQARDPETGWCYKNGGQPLWGYRIRTIDLGRGKSNRENLKAIWELDDTIAAGRSTHEIARHCLLEMAAKGASLDELRDFCNNSGIPGRRKRFWSTSTWHSLLEPHVLLQYCGYGIWNVHRKNGTKRPSSEWVVVPNAHPALISEDQARQILDIRASRKRYYGSQQRSLARTKSSSQLLSGGVFRCSRCGSNMVSMKSRGHEYYICGSAKYRRGLGCGDGVYIPKRDLEGDVLGGIQNMLSTLVNTPRLTRKVNDELRRLSGHDAGGEPTTKRRLKEVDEKIANLMRALEAGVISTEVVNGLKRLEQEKAELSASVRPASVAPQIDVEQLRVCMRNLQKAIATDSASEIKRIIGQCVEEMTLEPEEPKVVIKQITPGLVAPALYQRLVAGAGFEPATFGL